MENKGLLRRSLRQIPEFRSLPAHELDAVLERMTLKEYRAGQILWRTERRLHFWGVIQEGEIALEHRSYGVTTYTCRRRNGDLLDPNRWKPRPNHMSLARALTDVKLYILARKPPARSVSGAARLLLPRRTWTYDCLSVILIMVVVLSFGFADLRRIFSDALVLTAQQRLILPPPLNEQTQLLGFAEDLDPDSSFAYNQQGSLLFQTGDLMSAGNFFAAAADVDPASGAALNNLAVTYFARGQVGRAVQVQQQALLYDPDNAQVLENLGVMLMKMGRKREALRAFKEASFIRPDRPVPQAHQALLYLQLQQYPEAEVAISKAIALEPEQPAGYVILAIALYEQARDAEALMALEAALARSPEQTTASFYKALILGRQGKKEDAIILLETLLPSAHHPLEKSRIIQEIRFLENQLQTSLPP
jgi:tetratricopeptide (TPR) repeat protein